MATAWRCAASSNREDDCDWVVLYPDGAFRMSEIGSPCGPIPLDATIDTIVIHRPAVRRGRGGGGARREELEQRLRTPYALWPGDYTTDRFILCIPA